MSDNNDSIFLAMIWMLIISVLLFWLPLLGPLIAGIVGGKKAGGILAGLSAAILPGLLICILLFFAGTMLTSLPLIGAVLSAAGLLIYLFYIPTLLIGALIGGLLK